MRYSAGLNYQLNGRGRRAYLNIPEDECSQERARIKFDLPHKPEIGLYEELKGYKQSWSKHDETYVSNYNKNLQLKGFINAPISHVEDLNTYKWDQTPNKFLGSQNRLDLLISAFGQKLPFSKPLDLNDTLPPFNASIDPKNRFSRASTLNEILTDVARKDINNHVKQTKDGLKYIQTMVAIPREAMTLREHLQYVDSGLPHGVRVKEDSLDYSLASAALKADQNQPKYEDTYPENPIKTVVNPLKRSINDVVNPQKKREKKIVNPLRREKKIVNPLKRREIQPFLPLTEGNFLDQDFVKGYNNTVQNRVSDHTRRKASNRRGERYKLFHFNTNI